ncbi:hypothetical protein ACTOB_002490 [Actinoplanes oblitus]|uniref:Uncharacterized protein n=1 Tax=Actinoplanes oblitus TaxID=3040509 RepID=A0ABY8WPR6_9ACTN|nr:hypothetical protein [Actinoplanes oblitus]WIM98870.1 hypothetical protein ACTOB_002490 [Actinoplanes oblitus]
MDDDPVAGPAVRVTAQLFAVWLFGAVAPLVSGGFLLAAIWGGGAAGQLLVPVVLAADVAVLFLVVRLTREATWLGATAGRRLLWAVLVAGLGGALWGLGWGVSDAAGFGLSHGNTGILFFGGLAFVLVAGLLAKPWPVPVVSAVLLAVVAGVGLQGLRASAPDDLTERLAHAGKQRDDFWALRVPGYRPVGALRYGPEFGGDRFEPVDPALIPQARFYTVHTQPFEIGRHPETCAAHLLYATRSGAFGSDIGKCETESGGLLHVTSASGTSHAYLRRAGGTLITVEGTDTVSRPALRAAVRAARPATSAELAARQATGEREYFVAPAPGYRLLYFGSGGTEYEPSDGINGIEDAMIDLRVAKPTGPVTCSLEYTCAAEPGGLTYERSTDQQGYLLQRLPYLIHVTGGLAVDRDRLREAARNVRPATDAELRALLPEPAPRGPIDALRRRLR